MSTLPAAWSIVRLNSISELSKEILTPTTSATPRITASTVSAFLSFRLGIFFIAILVNDDWMNKNEAANTILTIIIAAISLEITMPKTDKKLITGNETKSINDWRNLVKKSNSMAIFSDLTKSK
jgi:hypothetical protein